jgi:hypothetical protein
MLGSTDGVPTSMRNRGATKAINWFSLPVAFEHKEQDDWEPPWSSIDVGEDIIDVGINAEEHDLIAVVSTYVLSLEAFWSVLIRRTQKCQH